METSPLAPLQPNIPRPFSRRCDPIDFTSGFNDSSYHIPGNFNFQNLAMEDPKSDYFSFNPVRGSSPTASLAADLSQNFHIDQTPALPTPRRALFTNNNALELDFNRIPTPPIPSSSPGLENSSMDISPLPHKPAFFQAATGLPTPDPTPTETEPCMTFPPPPPPVPQTEMSNFRRPSLTHQRRTSNPTRPSLRKGYSVSSVGPRASVSSVSEPPFTFGAKLKPPSKPLETFLESPPSERKPYHSSSTPSLAGKGPPPKMILPYDGSPIGGIRRASGSKISTSRTGLGRRTQSLQHNDPCRASRQEKRCCTEGIMRVNNSDLNEDDYKLRLPHFKPDDEIDGLPRITRDTLVDVLNGEYRHELPNSTVIDCRFEYEFQGGHIEGAMNFNDKDVLAHDLFDNHGLPTSRAIIFHCEYSAHRAPLMAKYIRQRDRAVNHERYPNLTFPEIYILDGGYSAFFHTHRNLCSPQNYVGMESKDHEQACERGLAKVKRRAKLSRSHTYAFGQSSSTSSHDHTIDNSGDVAMSFMSPLASTHGLGCLAPIDAMDVDFSPSIAFEPINPDPQFTRFPRRLETY